MDSCTPPAVCARRPRLVLPGRRQLARRSGTQRSFRIPEDRRLEGLRPVRPTRPILILLHFLCSIVPPFFLLRYHPTLRTDATSLPAGSDSAHNCPIHPANGDLRLDRRRYVSSTHLPFFFPFLSILGLNFLNSFMILSWTRVRLLGMVEVQRMSLSTSSHSRTRCLGARVAYEQRLLVVFSIGDEAGYALIVRIHIPWSCGAEEVEVDVFLAAAARLARRRARERKQRAEASLLDWQAHARRVDGCPPYVCVRACGDGPLRLPTICASRSSSRRRGRSALASFHPPGTRKGAPCLLVLPSFVSAACVPFPLLLRGILLVPGHPPPSSTFPSPSLYTLSSPDWFVLSLRRDFVYLSRSRVQTADR
jgi:hypothetical protein